MASKVPWSGDVVGVQPRIRLTRSFDERHHSYLGYVVSLDGVIGDEARRFAVGVGKVAHAKHALSVGCRVEGFGVPPQDPQLEIVDHWNPRVRRYRRETFCYGPKSCPIYKPGPTRKVPGRKGMSYEEQDWVDEDATAHRGPDE